MFDSFRCLNVSSVVKFRPWVVKYIETRKLQTLNETTSPENVENQDVQWTSWSINRSCKDPMHEICTYSSFFNSHECELACFLGTYQLPYIKSCFEPVEMKKSEKTWSCSSDQWIIPFFKSRTFRPVLCSSVQTTQSTFFSRSGMFQIRTFSWK